MATRSLGTLTLDLVAKIGGFTAGMDQAARISDKRMREIERRAKQFGTVLGTTIAAGATAAFAGLVAVTKSAIDNADAMRDLSIRVGVSTETLSAYAYTAKQTGTDIEALGKGLKILAKNAADAINPTSAQAKVFDALGVSVTDSTGKLKPLDQLIPAIADKFKLLQDGTTKAALAQALFGKSGLELTEFLNQGSDGLDAFAQKAADLGIIIDSKTAAAADNFKDTLGDLHTVVGGLGLGIARELLPQLQESASSLVDLVKEGNLASDVASVLGTAFSTASRILEGYTKAVDITALSMEYLTRVSQDFFTIQKNLSTLGFADGTIAGAARDIAAANREGNKALAAIHAGPAKTSPKVQFITAESGSLPDSALRQSAGEVAAQAKADALEKRLAKALSNPTATSAKKAKSGKSDAEREAEQVARAIEQMTKAQQDWEAEVSKTGNPIVDEYSDKLRQITEDGKNFAKDGVPADKVKAFVDQMTALATTVRDSEIVKFQQEFDDQTAEMAAHMQGPAAEALQTYREEVRKLDELLKTGAITITEYNARLKELGVVRDSPMTDVSKSIEEQIRLLGMTNEQQEIYNNLKAAGVDADSAWGQSIIANTEQLQKMREQVAFMDDAKASLADAWTDYITGAKSAKDAFGDFADHVYQTAIKWLADKAIQALFNGFGNSSSTTASGSTGGGFDWGSLISSFFGGGKAGGGSVTPGKFYEVGEYNRPEMLMSGGKQYMIPGNKGNVVPMGGGSAPPPMVFNFAVQGRVNRETGTQAGQRAAKELRLATSRNS